MADGNPYLDILNGSTALTPSDDTVSAFSGIDNDNPYFDLMKPEPQPDSAGAFGRSFARNVIPAAGGAVAAGTGAEAGALLGGGIGALFGGAGAVPGALIGGFIGGIGGGIGGSWATAEAQQYTLDALPDDWVDAIGQSREQQAKDAMLNPTETFLGGLVPNILTMKIGGVGAAAKLPANATAYQRIVANPITSRIFGGAVMGGMELGSELATGQAPNWTNVAIATGFGIVFNKPNKIGQKLTDIGAAPIQRTLEGRISTERMNAFEPTVAEAGDAKVMGPGITEEVFMGTQHQADDAAMVAQQAARVEAAVLGKTPAAEADVHALARRMEPEVFSAYDTLSEQRNDLRAHLAAISEGGEAGSPDALRARISQIDVAMRELSPQVSAAYRRAGDFAGSETVEPALPPAAEPAQAPSPAPEAPTQAGEVPSTGVTAHAAPIEQQLQFIADDVVRGLMAAGRPETEARAVSALIAQRYKTRAGRLGNAMTPQRLYETEGAVIKGYGRRPPLMPTVAQPSIAARVAEVPSIAEAPRRIPASELESIDPADIGVDAKRFQFKEGGDESGVTERLTGVEQWDPRLAGTALVWRDENGKNWIADGHQRVGLAKRLTEAGQQGIKVNAFVLDAKSGVTDAMARAIAAVKNIAEGTGSPVDAAKVLRVAKESGIDLPPLPPRSTLVRDGRALAELSPEAFGIIVNDVVPTSQGAIVGRLVRVPEQQVEALRLLAALKPDNVQQAEMIVRDMLSSGTTEGRQESLFGTEDYAASIVLERAKVADEAMKLLRKDKATFKTLVDEAERIQGTGANVLDQATNQSRLSTDEQAAEFLKLLAFRAGPVSDALSRVARQLKTGEIKTGEAARTFLGDVRAAVEAGVVDGPDAGSPVAGAVEQRPELDPNQNEMFQSGRKPDLWKPGDMLGEFETERGQEGFGQALVPGVKPVSDAERLRLAMAKPLTGGDAPPQRGSLFDVEGRADEADQLTLFQPAYHGSPHIFDKFEWSDKTRGKGEGAQAFGDGLYFAGKKEVAQHYRDTLSQKKPLDMVDGYISFNIRHGKMKGEQAETVDYLRINGLPHDAETVALVDRIITGGKPDRAGSIDYSDDAVKAFSQLDTKLSANKGRLYKVDIPDDAEMLAWDKPLAEQAPSVREKMAALGFEERKPSEWKPREGDADRPIIVDQYGSEIVQNEDGTYSVFGFGADGRSQRIARGDPLTLEQAKAKIGEFNGQQSPTGEQMYRELSRRMAGEQPPDVMSWTVANAGTSDFRGDVAASAALREAGIPGHRFLDQASRNAGEGTHNYVIYDDSRVNITEYEQQKRGSITFADNQRPIIKLFADADASTFVHETGHQWLEELMRDAVHPQATDILKTDAGTVRKWLGMGDDGKIATKQHEKFARGFEQYMREGTAPSSALARVFAQFKSWLTDIYQTIRGLGSPINEDIRQVFDRMIEMEPQRTVVAPERDDVAGLSGIHETEATDVSPAQAEPVGDRIVAERDSYIAQQSPEVLNELAAAEQAAAAADGAPNAGAENPAGEVGRGPLPAAGAEPGTIAPIGAGGGERAPLNAGGAQGMGESASPQARGTTAAGSAGEAGLRQQRSGAADVARAGQPLAPDASTLFGPQESPFLDKAGNLRLENLTNNEDVRQAIRDAAEANQNFIGDTGGPVTFGQIMDLAEAAGMEGAEELVRTRVKGQAFNPVEVMVLRKALVESATNLSGLAKKAAASKSEADELAYMQAELKHNMLQGTVAQATAVWGRTGMAFRNIIEGQRTAANVDALLKQTTGKTLFQLKERIALMSTLDTPGQVSKLANSGDKRTISGGILEYFINALVSGPKTHVTNVVSNTISSLIHFGPDTATAAAIGAARRALGREGSRVYLGEVGAAMHGANQGLPIALRATGAALKTGRSATLPGETARELSFQPGSDFAAAPAVDMATTYRDIMPDLYGATRGILDSVMAMGKIIQAGGVKGAPLISLKYSPLGQIPDIAVKGVTALPVGTAARIPTRMLAAEDTFARTMNLSMELNRLAFRTAREEGLTGSAFDARIAEIRLNPSEEIMAQARTQASDLALMSRDSKFVQALSHFANTPIMGVPIVKFIIPFINTPASIIEQAVVRRTPLAFASPEVRADLMGKNGTIAQDTAIARLVVGSAVSVAFGALAAQGLVTGSPPSDPGKAALWRLAGNQAHSVRIGDLWYKVNQLGPLGMLSGIAADMYDVAHAASAGDLEQVGSGLQQAFMQNILDASFMTGPADLIQALEDPDRYGQQYVKKFLSAFIPYSGAMGQITRATDPYSRQARDVMDTLKAKVPGLSETLWPRRDIWGQPVPSQETFGPSILSSMYVTQMSTDPVNLAMFEAGYWPGAVDRKIRGVELTDGQYDQYAAIAGTMMKKQLDRIVNSAQWQTWPPEVRHSIIQETIRQSRETARGYMMSKHPQIGRDATAIKMAPFQSGE